MSDPTGRAAGLGMAATEGTLSGEGFGCTESFNRGDDTPVSFSTSFNRVVLKLLGFVLEPGFVGSVISDDELSEDGGFLGGVLFIRYSVL